MTKNQTKRRKLTAAEAAEADARMQHFLKCLRFQRIYEAAQRHGRYTTDIEFLRVMIESGEVTLTDGPDGMFVRGKDIAVPGLFRIDDYGRRSGTVYLRRVDN